MTDDLYPRDMLRAASDVRHAGQLAGADGSATLDNPFCGDRVSFDVSLDDHKRITAVRHRVKACVLCQASAALLAEQAAGHTGSEIADLGETLLAGLKHGAAPLLAQAPAFDLFTTVAPHRSRFACVLLPFETLEAAARTAEEKS